MVYNLLADGGSVMIAQHQEIGACWRGSSTGRRNDRPCFDAAPF